jgi:hypothetical protein
MKTITLSADEALIEAAKTRAQREHSTLEEQFRLWLEEYSCKERQLATARELLEEMRSQIQDNAKRKHHADAAMNLTKELQGKYSTQGRKFSCDEMNER